MSNYPDDYRNYIDHPRHPDYIEPPEDAEEEYPEAELERQLERMRSNEEY